MDTSEEAKKHRRAARKKKVLKDKTKQKYASFDFFYTCKQSATMRYRLFYVNFSLLT